MKPAGFHYAWKPEAPQQAPKNVFKTGVSLHGHTWNSFEGLSFLPGITNKVSPLRKIMQWVEKRYQQKWHAPFDYDRGYWTSPVSPEVAYNLEAHQIEQHGFRPLVSLTDHDTISGCETLPVVPLSLEWTAPYHGAVLHIGVHNLPAAAARPIVDQLQKYTANPSPHALKNLLGEINTLPDALLVLNHPLSDQGRIGFEIHSSLVKEFLKTNIGLIHALEVNALQSWDSNRRVAHIASEVSLPLISGGDRHGFEPNGAINLTNAESFSAFAHEIRHEKKSEILFMPQCQTSLVQRYGENINVILDDYPNLPGHVFWYDRIFYKCPDGVTRRLSEMFDTTTTTVKTTNFFIGFLGLATRAARPISPIFAESRKSM